jgi:hypothetical protein
MFFQKETVTVQVSGLSIALLSPNTDFESCSKRKILPKLADQQWVSIDIVYENKSRKKIPLIPAIFKNYEYPPIQIVDITFEIENDKKQWSAIADTAIDGWVSNWVLAEFVRAKILRDSICTGHFESLETQILMADSIPQNAFRRLAPQCHEQMSPFARSKIKMIKNPLHFNQHRRCEVADRRFLGNKELFSIFARDLSFISLRVKETYPGFYFFLRLTPDQVSQSNSVRINIELKDGNIISGAL